MKKTALLFLSALMLLCPLYSYAEMSPAEKAYGALGTKVEMGSYYIGNEDDNYTWEPIQWVICDVNEADGRCLLVSWQILDNVRFGSSMWGHATDAEIWLSDFIWNFSDEEREHIVPVELEDEEYPGTTAGLFRLFLLSGFDILTNQYVRETGPTWYAISQGCKGE